jgi:hypothetical protein
VAGIISSVDDHIYTGILIAARPASRGAVVTHSSHDVMTMSDHFRALKDSYYRLRQQCSVLRDGD